MKAIPRVLSEEEAKQWGLPEMIPIIPPDEILEIEAMWSKYDLQQMARDYYLSAIGDKALLIEKLMYIGALDERGVATGMPMEPAAVPYVIGDPKKFCCRRCGACVPEELLKEGRFFDRMAWLRRHYAEEHPGVWGKGYAPSVEHKGKGIWYLGEWWDFEYTSAECVVYRSKDRKKRLYAWHSGEKEVKPAPEGIPLTIPYKTASKNRVRKLIEHDYRSIWEKSDREKAFALCNRIRKDVGWPEYSRETFDKGYQYRNIFAKDYKQAKEEFFNVILGWW